MSKDPKPRTSVLDNWKHAEGEIKRLYVDGVDEAVIAERVMGKRTRQALLNKIIKRLISLGELVDRNLLKEFPDRKTRPANDRTMAKWKPFKYEIIKRYNLGESIRSIASNVNPSEEGVDRYSRLYSIVLRLILDGDIKMREYKYPYPELEKYRAIILGYIRSGYSANSIRLFLIRDHEFDPGRKVILAMLAHESRMGSYDKEVCIQTRSRLRAKMVSFIVSLKRQGKSPEEILHELNLNRGYRPMASPKTGKLTIKMVRHIYNREK